MSSTSLPNGGSGEPFIHWQAFNGTIWAFTGLTLITLAIRLYTRWRTFRKLYWDDGLVIIAWLIVFINSVVWATQWWNMYAIVWWGAGLQPYPPELDDIKRWMDSMLAMQLLIFTCLTCVKVALLLFFRRLYGRSETKRQKQYWWFSLISTLVVYVISMATPQFKCYTNDFIYINDHCNSGWFVTESLIIMTVVTVLNLLTDIFILAIPVNIVWSLQIRWRKKLALVGLFSLTFITMAIAIVRIVVLHTTRKQLGSLDPIALVFWSLMEIDIAVLIACLSSFPQLFVRSKPRQVEKPNPTASMIERVRRRMARGGRAPSTPETALFTKDSQFSGSTAAGATTAVNGTTLAATGITSHGKPDPDADTSNNSSPALVPKQGWTGAATTTTQITSPVESEDGIKEPEAGVIRRFEYQVAHDHPAVPRKPNDSSV
ncbi:hypothetical protein QBC40DRAFT_314240 [Triangularia verruculosa]|uniref:Rhodopsin domain-containing protein n=1 Tax=Triangularia verruculosa TaxID=2587418 RepID=A0AAN7AP91_9PEZI|nr:hypothetical protein QBC40DRAFT_314240 [Triangularia verruculosa]